jgi:hypothetical protein
MLLIRSDSLIYVIEVKDTEEALISLLENRPECAVDWVIVGSHDEGTQMDPDEQPFIVRRKKA